MHRLLMRSMLYVAFLAIVLTGVTKVFHWRYLQRITPAAVPPEAPAPKGMDRETAARIGGLHPARRGSFQLAAREKPPGTVRIGAFGDSFTYGLEVDEGLDWPSQLELLLRENGAVRVEVLNFGNPGFGTHQTHMMAELVAPQFGIDYAVFAALPAFWAGRDRTFTFWPPGTRGATHLGFHSRYVLAGDDVALVDPIGATEPERFAAYTRFLYPLRYLRFDERPPPFLQAWLPEGRTLSNPFYYSRLPRLQEVAEIYRRLLRRQLRAGPPTLVIETMDDLSEILGSDPQLAAHVIRGAVPKRFPYMAPQLHWSPWGQRLVAEEAARAFGVAAERPTYVVEVEAGPPAGAAGDESLAGYDKIHVDIGGVAVGALYQHPRGDYTVSRMDRLPPTSPFLVALAAPGQPLVDAVFVPLAQRPEVDTLIVDSDGGSGPGRSVPLLWVDAAIARADLCSREVLGKWAGDETPEACPLVLDWDLDVPWHPLVVRVGDQPVADVGRNPGSFNPGTLWIRGPYFRAHADGGSNVEPAQLPAEGDITLVLEQAGVAMRRVPLGRYRRVSRPPQTAPIPALRVTRSAGPPAE
jgi:hypothetical protein